MHGSRAMPRDADHPRELVVPVVEERVAVHRERRPTARIRVHKTVEREEVEVDGDVVRESVEVERVPVNCYVLEAPRPRVEGDVTIIPVLEEVVVVEKRLLVKEEVHIRKRRRIVRRRLRVPLKKERVQVESSPRNNEKPRSRRTA